MNINQIWEIIKEYAQLISDRVGQFTIKGSWGLLDAHAGQKTPTSGIMYTTLMKYFSKLSTIEVVYHVLGVILFIFIAMVTFFIIRPSLYTIYKSDKLADKPIVRAFIYILYIISHIFYLSLGVFLASVLVLQIVINICYFIHSIKYGYIVKGLERHFMFSTARSANGAIFTFILIFMFIFYMTADKRKAFYRRHLPSDMIGMVDGILTVTRISPYIRPIITVAISSTIVLHTIINFLTDFITQKGYVFIPSWDIINGSIFIYKKWETLYRLSTKITRTLPNERPPMNWMFSSMYEYITNNYVSPLILFLIIFIIVVTSVIAFFVVKPTVYELYQREDMASKPVTRNILYGLYIMCSAYKSILFILNVIIIIQGLFAICKFIIFLNGLGVSVKLASDISILKGYIFIHLSSYVITLIITYFVSIIIIPITFCLTGGIRDRFYRRYFPSQMKFIDNVFERAHISKFTRSGSWFIAVTIITQHSDFYPKIIELINGIVTHIF